MASGASFQHDAMAGRWRRDGDPRHDEVGDELTSPARRSQCRAGIEAPIFRTRCLPFHFCSHCRVRVKNGLSRPFDDLVFFCCAIAARRQDEPGTKNDQQFHESPPAIGRPGTCLSFIRRRQPSAVSYAITCFEESICS